MSDENLLFANRLSNRLACTKAAALAPPWPAPHAKACTLLPRTQVLANKKTAVKACCCKPRSAGAHHQNAKQSDDLAVLGVLSELRAGKTVSSKCHKQAK